MIDDPAPAVPAVPVASPGDGSVPGAPAEAPCTSSGPVIAASTSGGSLPALPASDAVPPLAPLGNARSRELALSILLILAFLAVAYIASPLWVGLVLGTMMAFSAHALFRRLRARLGNRPALAALLTTLGGGLLALVGGALAVYMVTRQVVLVVSMVKDQLGQHSLEAFLGPKIVRWIDASGIDRSTLLTRFEEELGRLASSSAGVAAVILERTTSALLMLVIALFTMNYTLLEWPRLASRLERLLPLDPRHTRALVQEFREVGRTAFVGTIATAAVQGVFASIGYAICGVPEPIGWGVLTGFGSFVPVIGTALVWVPVAIYLFLEGHPGWAVLELAWGAVVVMALADYGVRPRLVGKKDEQPTLLMLVALIGGVEVFGLAGLVVGPVVISLFLALVRIYERDLPPL